MRILVTNDDGVFAPGLVALATELAQGHQVSIVAPEYEQSAVGHAITLSDPLRVKEVMVAGRFKAHALNGTPADCVKIGVLELLKGPPDLVVSGINLGANVGFNVLYSGTVSAATEAALLGLPGLAVSIDSYVMTDLGPAARIASRLADLVLEKKLPRGVCLNVNVPHLDLSKIKGIVVTRQATTPMREKFHKGVDPHRRTYYWQGGQEPAAEMEEGTDLWALDRGLVSVCPLSPDLSSDRGASHLCDWDFNDTISRG